MLLKGLILSVTLLGTASAFPHFQDLVPNGNSVPHPCLDNYLWRGLGHKLSAGSGERNVFGQDFDTNGQKWDKCLCERDSDGDGKTNGEELGDPDCVWQPGELPSRVTSITHPGVCEPLDSPECQRRNDWEFCTANEFSCDAVDEPGVEEIVIQYPVTPIPPTETNYYCMTFDLPVNTSEPYHLIADRPRLNNSIVAHHILLFGCNDELGAGRDWRMDTPQPCGMAEQVCRDIIGLWTVGHPGSCVSEEFGFRLGQGGYTTIMMQIHWNNPELRDDYVDAPGMSLYVTKNLREHDGGVLMIGTQDIAIPPGQQSHRVEGHCRSECTENMPQDVFMDTVALHMHYLGVESGFSHVSKDGVLQRLIYEEHYSYDSPELYKFEQGARFQPGDSLSVSCTYKSTNKATTTYYGDGTLDEMCFAFIIYYPRIPRMSHCISYKSLNMCPGQDRETGGCDFETFFNETTVGARLYGMLLEVSAVCNKTGASPENCPAGCAETISTIRDNTPCLSGDIGYYVENEIILEHFGDFGLEFVRMLHICDENWIEPVDDDDEGDDDDDEGDAHDDDGDNDTRHHNHTEHGTTRAPLGTCPFDNPPIGGGAVQNLARVSGIITALLALVMCSHW